jgi:CDP-4-dehydro-6-deoxyglucose reductase, E3
VSHTVTLQASGKHFCVQPGESVLEAAQRAGLALPYSCLAGVCGSCKASLVEGEVTYPRNPPAALNASEQARHQVLLCQAVPASDLTLQAREVASVADLPRRELALTVSARQLLAPDVMQLILDPPPGERLRRLAGQYLDVLLADGKRRAFSIANAPEGGAQIELHIRHVAGGGFTGHVFDELRIGDVLRVEGPLGTFVPREDSERAMIFVAGGTGFAPVKALIEHFQHLGTRRPMWLYWGARRAADLYQPQLPQQWRAQLANFHYVPVVSDPSSSDGLRSALVHEAVIEDHADLSRFDIYMSGPPAMIDAGRRSFVEAGLDEGQLYYDSFDYAPDVLAAILRNRAGIHGL